MTETTVGWQAEPGRPEGNRTLRGRVEEAADRAIEALAAILDDLQAAEAAPLLCAGIATYNALRSSGVRAGDTVAVLGIGGLGHLGVQFAAKMGCRTVAIARGPGAAGA